MRKIYFLVTLLFAFGITAFSQTTIRTIYSSTVTAGTGYASSTGTRTTTNFKVGGTATGTKYRGYATFNLDSIPSGTIIDSCVIGLRVRTYGGTGTPSTTATYGYAGDLSTVTTGTTLYADCIAGTLISNAGYGTATGNTVLPNTTAAQAFINGNVGNVVTICFTGGTPRTYTFEGSGGTATTTGTTHRPYITVQYCTGVTSVTATASPNPVCPGGTLSLTGGGSGLSTYLWTGPGGFTSTLESPTLTASAASAGVYTFTGYNAGGCATSVVTDSVIVATAPGAVTGTSTVCPAGSVTLSDAVSGGSWSISPLSVATISSAGVVTGIAGGTATVTYGCNTDTTYSITVYPAPSAITGADSVCQGATIDLSSTPVGGAWSSSSTSIATVNSLGAVTGLNAGNTTIYYTLPTTCYITKPVEVNATPVAITGTPSECVGASTTFADGVPRGVWSSANAAIASVSGSGVVTGITSNRTVAINYSNECGVATIIDTVLRSPVAITGRDSVCAQSASLLADTVSGGTWTSSNLSVATVSSVPAASASVEGIGTGSTSIVSTTITYTLPSGCAITTPFTVIPLPDPINGPSAVCPGATIAVADLVSGGTWSSDNTSVATVNNAGVVRGISPDSVKINYTMPLGCFVSKSILVYHLPAPISGGITVCAIAQDTLTDDSLGGRWSSSDITKAEVSPTGVVSGISGGDVVITYTLPTGCFITDSILVHPSPIPVITYSFAAASFSTDTGYVSYQWFYGTDPGNLTAIPGAVSYNLATVYDDYYTVEVTDSFGCVNSSLPYHMTNVGVKNVPNSHTISIYPNPATTMLYIASSVQVSVIITDMSGKMILQQHNASQMDIHTLPAGIYTVAVYDDADQQVLVEKLVKE